MQIPIAAGLAFTSLALAACGGGGRAVEINPQEHVVGSRWNATLATPAGLEGASQVRGSAWMGAEDGNAASSVAHVAIRNAVPGGEHPWHVHSGQCGKDMGIFGPADAYEPLRVEDNGQAESTAELNVPLPGSGQYHVNVHASRNNMGTIVACGNLAPPIK